jgi:hypothetical protein
MSQNEINAIKAVYPEFTRSIGQAMWCVFTGNYPVGSYRNVYLPNGQLCQHTVRSWGQIIADARGHSKESYTTYWESHVPEAKFKAVEKKFKKAGWKFSEEPVNLDANDKLRDESIAALSVGIEIPKPKVAAPIDTIGLIPPKKRGRPPKVK